MGESLKKTYTNHIVLKYELQSIYTILNFLIKFYVQSTTFVFQITHKINIGH